MAFGASVALLGVPKENRLLVAGSPAFPLAKLNTGAFARAAGCSAGLSGVKAKLEDDGLAASLGVKKDFAGAAVKLKVGLKAPKDGNASVVGLASVLGFSAFGVKGTEKLN